MGGNGLSGHVTPLPVGVIAPNCPLGAISHPSGSTPRASSKSGPRVIQRIRGATISLNSVGLHHAVRVYGAVGLQAADLNAADVVMAAFCINSVLR